MENIPTPAATAQPPTLDLWMEVPGAAGQYYKPYPARLAILDQFGQVISHQSLNEQDAHTWRAQLLQSAYSATQAVVDDQAQVPLGNAVPVVVQEPAQHPEAIPKDSNLNQVQPEPVAAADSDDEDDPLYKPEEEEDLDDDEHGDRDFTCDTCNKGYKTLRSLENHVCRPRPARASMSSGTYHCDVCGKGFSQRGSLTIHTAVHLNNKPFECKECNKTFSLKGNLQKHIAQVHAKSRKVFKCCFCNYKSVQKGNTKTHMSRIHKKSAIPIEEICTL